MVNIRDFQKLWTQETQGKTEAEILELEKFYLEQIKRMAD